MDWMRAPTLNHSHVSVKELRLSVCITTKTATFQHHTHNWLLARLEVAQGPIDGGAESGEPTRAQRFRWLRPLTPDPAVTKAYRAEWPTPIDGRTNLTE